MKKYKVFLLSLISFFILCNGVKATTLRDLYNDLSALEKSYAAAQKKKNLTQAEMNNVRASIASTEAEIRQAQSDITQAEKDIAKSEEDINKKKEETNQMLLYLQLSNSKGNSMLEYVFEADNYTDFIYRYSVVTQMSDYNQGLVDELNTLVKQLNSKKETLALKQTELAKKKNDLQAKYLIVQAQYKSDEDDSMDVATQISDKKKLIKKYENMGCSRNQNINSCGSAQAVDGWTYPLNSFRQSSNYGWDENRYHYAVDLGTGEGSPVKAVANGIVLSSGLTRTLATCNYNGSSPYLAAPSRNCHCGGYVIQIQHNMPNGSSYVSLYMHLLSASVSVGDKVTGGQVIASSGGGPQEAKKWVDHCTGGPHLHFTMSYGASPIGTSSVAGSTFDPVKFFPAMKGIGSSYRG